MTASITNLSASSPPDIAKVWVSPTVTSETSITPTTNEVAFSKIELASEAFTVNFRSVGALLSTFDVTASIPVAVVIDCSIASVSASISPLLTLAEVVKTSFATTETVEKRSLSSSSVESLSVAFMRVTTLATDFAAEFTTSSNWASFNVTPVSSALTAASVFNLVLNASIWSLSAEKSMTTPDMTVSRRAPKVTSKASSSESPEPLAAAEKVLITVITVLFACFTE